MASALSAEIKHELARRGLTGVSVRVRQSAWSEHVTFTIRSLEAARRHQEVEDYAKRVAVQQVDDYGHPLRGGNVYVEVEWAPRLIGKYAGPLYAALKLLPRDGTMAEVAPHLYAYYDVETFRYRASHDHSGWHTEATYAHLLASFIAQAILIGKVSGPVVGQGDKYPWPPPPAM